MKTKLHLPSLLLGALVALAALLFTGASNPDMVSRSQLATHYRALANYNLAHSLMFPDIPLVANYFHVRFECYTQIAHDLETNPNF